jgi:3-hydroxymyristoyl/3-hydroxydecanoyl-(acyl carrier protein) dehydratase
LPKVKIQVNAEGALQIQSPHLPAEYIPAAQSDWYTMDDAVRLHSNGRFDLLGRLDRIVKIEEKRFSLLAIEQALLSLADVKDAAVFAENENGREYIAAVLVLHQDDTLQMVGKYRFCEQLKQQLQPIMAQLAIPRCWRFVAELPMNAQGKVSQAALKALFAPEALCAPVALLPRVASLQQDAACATYQLHIDANIAYFSGHFQHMPVLPGVTQIHWAVQFARQLWPIAAQFERMEVIKFQHIIQPDCQVQLQLEWDGTKLRFAYSSEAGAHSSGRLIFAPQGDPQ